MDAREIIRIIQESKKKTPVKVMLKQKSEIEFPECKTFGSGDTKIVFGD